MRGSLACIALLLGACASSPSGIELTLRFDPSVDDATLATITQLVVHATGDESGDYPITLGSPAQRTERLLYDPSATTKHVTLSATALAADDTSIASSAPYSLTAGHGASATLLLVATNAHPLDGGSLVDAGDLAGAPDMSSGHVSPVFVSSSQVKLAEGDGSNLVAPLPSGATAGMMLVAVATSAQFAAEPVSITPASGWTTLGTETTGDDAGITGFYWHVAAAGETSYSFAHDGVAQSSLTIMAYSGQDPTTPFDNEIVSGPHTSGTSVPLDAVTSTAAPDLRIALAVSPNHLNDTYTAPAGMTLRLTTTLLVADEPFATVGTAPAITGTSGSTVSTVTLSALVRGH